VAFEMVPAAVAASSAMEAGLSAGVAEVSPALLSVMHMGGDAEVEGNT
jgi:hypothetical protein